MSFEFIPRSVKKRRIESEASTSLSTDDKNLGPAQQEDHRPTTTKDTITKSISKQAYAVSSSTSVAKLKDTGTRLRTTGCFDLAFIVRLCYMGRRRLRRKIDWSSDVQSHKDREQDNANGTSNEGRGYTPLSYLFQCSPVFVQASSSASFVHHPETIYVKALRTHAAQLFDVRLVLSSEEPLFGHEATRKWSSSSGTQTGYEVRVKPHLTAGGKGSNEYGKADWDRLTVYVENIPIQYRSLPGTMKFITTLFSSVPSSEAQYSKIQRITFPPHHRDQPNSIPTCKGFALITLSSLQDANFLLERWPWDTPSKNLYPKEQGADPSYSHTLHDAVKFGFAP
ncbi:hypothetical protein BJ912DRAFT_3044 [Pholiota molesta]|nr:hypothetical protein BJ912DRAFT_3044 [Pholiota molesta]